MNRLQFEEKMAGLVKSERRIGKEILEMIVEAEKCCHHLACGYRSIFDWLVRGHKYTKAAAYRRMEAARVLGALPQVGEKIESGDLSLSTLAKAQTVMKAQEKITGKLSPAAKSEVVEQIVGLSQDAAEQQLAIMFPEVEVRNKKSTEFGPEAMAIFDRVRDLISHTIPNANLEDVFKYIGRDFLKRRDPLLKEAKTRNQNSNTAQAREVKSKKTQMEFSKVDSAAELKIENNPSGSQSEPQIEDTQSGSAAEPQMQYKRKPISPTVKRHVIQNAKGRCEYTDKLTGRRCESMYQIEIDHIQPLMNGGSNHIDNLRCLCRAHNQYRTRWL